jgi:hypothetical protein
MTFVRQKAPRCFCKFRRELMDRMCFETANQRAVGLAGLAVDKSAAKELHNLASGFFHAGGGFARLPHRPAALDHVV